MRGYDRPQRTMLTLVNPEQRVPANHRIRLIKELAEVALKELSPLFEQSQRSMEVVTHLPANESLFARAND